MCPMVFSRVQITNRGLAMTDKSIIMRQLVLSHLHKRPVHSQRQRTLQRRYPRIQGRISHDFCSDLHYTVDHFVLVRFLPSFHFRNSGTHNFFNSFLLKRAIGVRHIGLDLSGNTHTDLKITRWRMTSSHEYNAFYHL